MRFLLDTHAFIWFILNRPALSSRARSIIEDGNSELLLSMASLWEMAILTSLGRFVLTQPFAPFMQEQLELNDIRVLPITLDHVAVVATLPFHHRDPFDRLLIAQSIVEGIPLISRDPAFIAYGMSPVW